ncbi:MAG: metallophosphoesterase [Bacteroidales bacterium]|nr:metallophosphoesterase [Bacteroidales bacterium]
MNTCYFVSDLHGKLSRYEALLKLIKKEKPDFVFLGGDLFPQRSLQSGQNPDSQYDFVRDFMLRKFSDLKENMDCAYPEIFVIPGNDDLKILFDKLAEGEKADLWRNLHNRCVVIGKYRFYGYGCVPPTPFRIKDWDRFDFSKEIEPGCIAPADGYHSLPPEHDPENDTIEKDLQILVKDENLEFGVFLFHSPPFNSLLDVATLRIFDPELQPVTLNVGSKAIRNFIDEKQPYITMHGHIHESARNTGEWKQNFGRTLSFSAAHDGPELVVIKFELNDPLSASRRLIKT